MQHPPRLPLAARPGSEQAELAPEAGLARFNPVLAVALLTLALFGCATAPAPAARSIERKESVIYVGMLFEQADARLKQYGAEPTMFQMALTPKAYKQGKELHYYVLRSGPTLEMISQPGKEGRSVGSMSVSTYVPKSWDSKLDPERDKFFETFRNLEGYDLEKEPTQSPAPAAAHP